MAVGKNKRLSKGGKKGIKKKIIDPFSKKDWYEVKAPATFSNRSVGKTLCSRTQGTRIASDSLKGRVFEVNQSELSPKSATGGTTAEDVNYRKFRLICEEVYGNQLLTQFHGMALTRDKICAIIKKWRTLIEAHCDVRTTDGYVLRFFCIAFTKEANQSQKQAYAKSTQVRAIRRKMISIITKEVTNNELKEVVKKLIPDNFASDIQRTCGGIYPLQDVYIRKVKVLKKPKFDLGKLLELHQEQGAPTGRPMPVLGEAVDRPDAAAATTAAV
jgi:small subunit ribosomal protein S3Ae